MKIIIILVALLLFGLSCNKNKPGSTIVNGTVINLAENVPLAGAEVRLVEGYGTISHSGSTVIAAETTNINGTFNFDFIAKPSRWYTVSITDLNLFLKSVNQEITKNKTNEVVLKPIPIAFGKTIIDGNHGADSMNLKIVHEFDESFHVDRSYEAGFYSESSMTKGRSGRFFYEIIRFNNGVGITEYDTINRIPYEEHVVEIKF